MTRTTDDLNPERFQPLGAPIRKAPESKPEWKPRDGSPGIEESTDGRLRTNIPANDRANWISITISASDSMVTPEAIRRGLKGMKCRT